MYIDLYLLTSLSFDLRWIVILVAIIPHLHISSVLIYTYLSFWSIDNCLIGKVVTLFYKHAAKCFVRNKTIENQMTKENYKIDILYLTMLSISWSSFFTDRARDVQPVSCVIKNSHHHGLV